MIRMLLILLLLLGAVVGVALWLSTFWAVMLVIVYVFGLIAYIKIKCAAPREDEWGETPYCKQCGYDLTGLTEPRCPECGKTLDLQIFE